MRRMTRGWIWFGLLVASMALLKTATAAEPAAFPLTKVILAMPRANYEELFPLGIKGEAFAVCPVGSGFELKPVRVKIKKLESQCSGTTVLQPAIEGCPNFLFLVAGYRGFSPKTFVTAAVTQLESRRTDPGEWKADITLNGAAATLTRVRSSENRLSLALAAGGVAQTIYNFRGEYCSAKVTWAGDLDGDRKLDLLLEIFDGDDAPIYILYLSRYAAAGQLVKEVSREKFLTCQ